ncbi:uncharacterized protein LOC141704237 [Apium graveolens]|uniref:uncharacterized protein LOC141704237 n=1 Tax=Apium graveolens TaxID=4045 RepID=UPI003D797E3A
MKDLRHIALCSVLYKILAKVLANWLKRIPPSIISEHQSAFVPGRNISDNVLVSFELIQYMKQKKRGAEGDIALKLDVSKSYDRVDWNFIRNRMVSMGFDDKWVKWIMFYVTTVSYSICFNGTSVVPPMGIFIYDSFLFFKANTEQAAVVKELLNTYERLSGQSINFQKSGIMFSSNVRLDKQIELTRILGVSNDLRAGSYLGLPSLVRRAKKSVFSFLKEMVWQKIQGWSAKLLSKAVNTVLLRNVAQAIPSYCMTYFLIPKNLCKEIETPMNGYWWKSNAGSNRGIRWASWNNMNMAKNKGALGFRDLHGFNLALLGKHVWNFVNNLRSLAAIIFKARYFSNDHIFHAKRGGGDSFIWSGIWKAKESLKNSFRWVLGDDVDICAFSDPLVRGRVDFNVDLSHRSANKEVKASDFFLTRVKSWDVNKVRESFSQNDAQLILGTRVPQNNVKDRVAWSSLTNGCYSAKTGYKLWQNHFVTCIRPPSSPGWYDGQVSTKGWVAPAYGEFKLNVDASIKEGEPFFSIEMVIRNCRGNFVRGRTMKCARVVSVLEAEAVGVREALLWLLTLPHMKPMKFESDSLVAVNAISKGTVYRV